MSRSDRGNDLVLTFGVALAARLALVAWAGPRFPPAADGTYYDTLAQRLLHGEGYTWLWPDGAVTFAAHYPVGYPALLAIAYGVVGPGAIAAMLLHAVLGAAGAAGVHRVAAEAMPRGRARLAGLAVALHPSLVAYTAAVMTEGVTASLLSIAAACAVCARDRDGDAAERPRWRWRVATGLVMGLATLVRPQCLLLAPLLGAQSVRATRATATPTATSTPTSTSTPTHRALEWRHVASGGLAVLAIAVAACLPWTARNCVRMQRCALVSVNAGWNLLIGTQTVTGGWAEIVVPPGCRTVWGEADKDVCFERAARHAIASDLGSWLARTPAKLDQTLDGSSSAAWYLHTANSDSFGDGAKNTLDALEVLVTRLLLGLALVAAAGMPGPRRRARWAVAALGLPFAALVNAWIAYAALAVVLGLRGLRETLAGPMLPGWAAGVVVATAATHAVFFGAGRYGIVVLPVVAALAAGVGGGRRTIAA